MSFSKKIKTILFPTRTVLRSVEKKMDSLQRTATHLLAEIRKNQIRKNSTFRNHLEKMAGHQGVADNEISYSFRFTAAELEPEITHHDVSKIAVATVCFGDAYRESVGKCLGSHRHYCDKWNYAHVDLKLPPGRLLRHPSWYKIPLIYHLIKLGYRQIAFIDADALITNPEIKIDGFFDRLSASGKDLLLAHDEAGINMGIFFVRESAALVRLLDLIWMFNFDEDNTNWEQYALRHLIDDFSFLEERLLVAANAKEFNSFPKERAILHKLNSQKNTWTAGDFICHFSGIRPPQIEDLIVSYMKEASIFPG